VVRICIAEDDRRASSGVRLLIALLVVALLAVGCGSNATDERSVEDRRDAGAPDVDEQPDPGSAPESPALEDEVTEEAGDAGGDEEVEADPRVRRCRSDPTLQARTLTTPHRCSSTIGSSLRTCGGLSWRSCPREWGSTG
jgi:hypothetical protein